MKTGMAVICAVVLTGGGPAFAAGADDSTCRKDVNELLDRLCSAFDYRSGEGAVSIAAPDPDEAAAIAIPDATMRYADGTTMSIGEWREMIRKNFKEMETMKSLYKIMELEVEGSRAVVTYILTHTYTLKKDTPSRCTSTSRWRTMVTKTPQGWRMKNYVQLSEETTRAGKPIAAGSSPVRW